MYSVPSTLSPADTAAWYARRRERFLEAAAERSTRMPDYGKINRAIAALFAQVLTGAGGAPSTICAVGMGQSVGGEGSWTRVNRTLVQCRQTARSTGLEPDLLTRHGPRQSGVHRVPFEHYIGKDTVIGWAANQLSPVLNHPEDKDAYRAAAFQLSWLLGVMLGGTGYTNAVMSKEIGGNLRDVGNVAVGYNPRLLLDDDGFVLALGGTPDAPDCTLHLTFPVDRRLLPRTRPAFNPQRAHMNDLQFG